MKTSLATGTVYKKLLAAVAVASLLLTSTPALADEAVTPLTVSLSSSAPDPVGGPFGVTAMFSSAVNDFDSSDVQVTFGMLSNFQSVSSTTYTFTVTPGDNDPNNAPAGGSVHVDIHSGAATDASNAGNTNAADQLSRVYDPSLTSGTSTGTSTDNGGTGTTTDNGSGTGSGTSTTPTIVMTGGPTEGQSINATTTTFTFTTTATTTCTFGAGSSFPCYDAAAPEQSVTLGTDNPGGLGDSAYTFVVIANNGSASTSQTIHFAVDTHAPTITLQSIATTNNNAPTSITFGSDEAGTPTVTGGCSVEATAAPIGTSTTAFGAMGPGTYTCTFTLVDAAGNTSNGITIPEFTVPAASGNSRGHSGGRGVLLPGASVADAGTTPTPAPSAPITLNTSGGVGGNGDSGTAGAGPSIVGGSALAVGGEVLGANTENAGTAATTTLLGGSSTVIGAGAAAAGSGAAIPAWAWFILALILLAALLYWAYRRSLAYETTR